MGTLRFNDGDVTVTLDGGLEDFVRRVLDAAAGETVRVMETAAEEVASDASSKWYGPQGVTRRTGRSGNIDTVTTVSDTAVRVSVGSTDLEKAKYVHRPGRLSTAAVEITAAEYRAEKAKGGALAKLVFHARKDRRDAGVKAGRFYKLIGNPKASDGKYLLPELVTKPAKAKSKEIIRDLGAAIATRAGR